MPVKIIVSVIITNDDKILMVQEGKDYKAGLWNFPTGVLKLGEKVTDAAIRKAIGEAGYDITITGFLKVYNYFIDVEKEWHILKIVLGGKALKEAANSESGQVTNAKWMTSGEIDEMLVQGKIWSPKMIKDALDVLRRRGLLSLDEILSDELYLE